MIIKRFKCPHCGYEFTQEVFESQEEAEEYFEKYRNKRPAKIRCQRCSAVL